MITESDKNIICDSFINELKLHALDVDVTQVNSVPIDNTKVWSAWMRNVWSTTVWITESVALVGTRIVSKMPQRLTHLIIGKRR